MKTFLLILAITFSTSASAGECYAAYKESKKLEKMVEGVYWTSEADDFWHGFASYKPIKEITKKEIARVLNLKDTIYGQPAFISMESSKELYNFIRYEIEVFDEGGAYEDEADARKFKKLINYIAKKYGNKTRLVMYGSGDGHDYFGGHHMMIFIMDNGCVLGLKAETVWT